MGCFNSNNQIQEGHCSSGDFQMLTHGRKSSNHLGQTEDQQWVYQDVQFYHLQVNVGATISDFWKQYKHKFLEFYESNQPQKIMLRQFVPNQYVIYCVEAHFLQQKTEWEFVVEAIRATANYQCTGKCQPVYLFVLFGSNQHQSQLQFGANSFLDQNDFMLRLSNFRNNQSPDHFLLNLSSINSLFESIGKLRDETSANDPAKQEMW